MSSHGSPIGQYDLEKGYGHSPVDVADTIRMSGKAGIAGGCIEDTALPNKMPYDFDFDFAVERISAAAHAARSLDEDFVLTARADGVMNGQYDTDAEIRRIQAFEATDAGVLYAPRSPSIEELARICESVSSPVNALVAEQANSLNTPSQIMQILGSLESHFRRWPALPTPRLLILPRKYWAREISRLFLPVSAVTHQQSPHVAQQRSRRERALALNVGLISNEHADNLSVTPAILNAAVTAPAV